MSLCRCCTLAFLLAYACNAESVKEKSEAGSPNIGNSTAHNATSDNHKDYAFYSRLLAGVLVLREGSIGKAAMAIPGLNAITQQYLRTQVMALLVP